MILSFQCRFFWTQDKGTFNAESMSEVEKKTKISPCQIGVKAIIRVKRWSLFLGDYACSETLDSKCARRGRIKSESVYSEW